MILVMDFYATSHFTRQNQFPLRRIEKMLEQAYLVKDRIAISAPGAIRRSARDVGTKIYAYYRSQKQKYVIVIGKHNQTQEFNVLVTIFKLDSPGWINKAFRHQPKKKRKLIREYLKFKNAKILNLHATNNNPISTNKQDPNILTIRQFGLELK